MTLHAALACWTAYVAAGNVAIQSFEHAKDELAVIYAAHRKTLYSGCAYGEDKQVDYRDCHYVPRRATERAERIEWEHVVPAEAFGQGFAAWREGDPACVSRRGHRYKGRKCASRVSAEYRLMEADMYNLYPEIGEINMLRSNYTMADIAGSAGLLEDVGSQLSERKFEPRDAAKGDVARTYLYMDATYPGRGIVARKNRKLFEAWSRMDPVDKWECTRARRIARIQGNENPFVARPCQEAGL